MFDRALSKVIIDNPKNHKDLDLSDHYPIIIQKNGLKIISYNVQFMPSVVAVKGKKNSAEIKQAVQEFANYFASQEADVCCVQELFNNKANALMEKAMRLKGYVATDRSGESTLRINGGTRTFIKKELAQNLKTYEYTYKMKMDYFVSGDALSNKGVTQVSIEKEGVTYHYFNTHLQCYWEDRDHYAELTLAQCVELKHFVTQQQVKGFIKPGDKIILCGDFNLPKPNPDEPSNPLYERMTQILGQQFSFIDYELQAQGPQHTRSSDNSYNRQLKKGNDLDVNLDMAIEYNPAAPQSKIDIELSEIYENLQLANAYFAKYNSHLFKLWVLTPEKSQMLEAHNKKIQALMQEAQILKEQNQNPLENRAWFTKALNLLQGPSGGATLENLYPEETTQEQPLDEAEEPFSPLDITTIEECQHEFNNLMFKLTQLNQNIHKDYVISPKKYQKTFEASLKLKHRLFNAGSDFFEKPSPQALDHFKALCAQELARAEAIFKEDHTLLKRFENSIKQIIGLIAFFSVLPALIIENTSTHGFKHTFFSPSSSPILSDLKEEYEKNIAQVKVNSPK